MARSGRVYIMQADDLLKVGFSINPERRAIELGGLTLLMVFDWRDDVEIAEKQAHKILKDQNLHVEHEYFSASLEEAACAVQRAYKEIDEPGYIKSYLTNEKIVHISIAEEIRAKLDDIRRAEKDIPGRSEMVRRLIERTADDLMEARK